MHTVMKITFYVNVEERKTKIVNGREIDDIFCFNRECKEFINLFNSVYHKYRKIDRREPERFEYAIPDNRENFENIFEMLKPFDKKMAIAIYFDTAYEKEDFEKAEAFLLAFPKEGYYYDDYPEDEYLSYSRPCDECYTYIPHKKTYIKPTNGITKAFQKCDGRTTLIEENIISLPLGEYLMQNGVSERNFSFVFTKSEKKLGYKFAEDINLMPENSIYNPSFGNAERCSACGKNLYYDFTEPTKMKKYFRGLRTGDYPNLNYYILTKEGAHSLTDINLTSDYFNDCRRTVINKKTFELIYSAVPSIKKRTIPILSEEYFEGVKANETSSL